GDGHLGQMPVARGQIRRGVGDRDLRPAERVGRHAATHPGPMDEGGPYIAGIPLRAAELHGHRPFLSSPWMVEPAGRIVYIGVSGRSSRLKPRALVLEDVRSVANRSASPGLDATIAACPAGAVGRAGSRPRRLPAATAGPDRVGAMMAGEWPAEAGPGPEIRVDQWLRCAAPQRQPDDARRNEERLRLQRGQRDPGQLPAGLVAEVARLPAGLELGVEAVQGL